MNISETCGGQSTGARARGAPGASGAAERRGPVAPLRPLLLALLALLAPLPGPLAPRPAAAQAPAPNPMVERLKAGGVAFGSLIQSRGEAEGAARGADARLDFVFYDMERSYDLEGFLAFQRGLRSGPPKALLVRIPPLADGREAAAERVAELLAAGADGIVFPHVRSREDAELGVALLRAAGRGVWPLDPDGRVVGYFMIESREGLANVREILATPGVSFGAPGQGSLRSALGDAAAVEQAIGTILSACRELGVVCAKLVDESDVERRIREGFRLILASGDALDIGRRLAPPSPDTVALAPPSRPPER